GDAWFPEYEQLNWKEISREEHAIDEKNAYACTFLTLEK
ncbi:MAG: dihydrofolate reductase, partial [Sulfuriflexus sp.]|nr:dihydrofolate reductase [Sulfuriflexus sp.]